MLAAVLLTACAPTPGAIDPAVSQASIGSTICVPGYARAARPSGWFTAALKRRQLPAGASPSAFEEDHIVAISLGGAPKDVRNLRPQPWAEARAKDRLEAALHRAVCAGEISLADAQASLARFKNAIWPDAPWGAPGR